MSNVLRIPPKRVTRKYGDFELVAEYDMITSKWKYSATKIVTTEITLSGEASSLQRALNAAKRKVDGVNDKTTRYAND